TTLNAAGTASCLPVSSLPPPLARVREEVTALLHDRAGLLASVLVPPMPLLLEGIGNLLRHVIFVVLGEHVVGLEHAVAVERAFRHNTLPFAEQVWQDALIGNRNGAVSVRHLEANRKGLAAGKAARSDESAEANASTRSDVFLGHVGGGIEKDNGILHCKQYQKDSHGKHAYAAGNQRQPPLLTRHRPLLLVRNVEVSDPLVEHLQLFRFVGERPARLVHRCFYFITLAHDHIGAQ